MACKCCPFNDGWNEEATIAQNYGCLPDKFQMMEKFDNEGVALSCHDTPTKACRGLTKVRPDAKTAPVLKYEDWYHGVGQETAVPE